ncbi:PQ loop repeat-containing protein [Natronincola peptidivorans]|uniref:PQ loop repeat-containing protein n=1 Tax=Natronincola peptidivorans TaxID=426128 RepID=A0A1I0B1Y9_9FIRM|nr:PQ-loop domain-containing transporter [Natronincola peptidivorans]SET00327.1 PQ loop repeat-containing protein [Natronincola peptidivorans]
MFSQMSIFEILMLLCFGAAWPFSIYKSYKSKSVAGKSPYFLMILIMGYFFGILNKIFYNYDQVVYLYGLNLVLVSTDLSLYFRNIRLQNSFQKETSM